MTTLPDSLNQTNYCQRVCSSFYFTRGYEFGVNPRMLLRIPRLIVYYNEETEGISRRPEYISSLMGFAVGITVLGFAVYGVKKFIENTYKQQKNEQRLI